MSTLLQKTRSRGPGFAETPDASRRGAQEELTACRPSLLEEKIPTTKPLSIARLVISVAALITFGHPPVATAQDRSGTADLAGTQNPYADNNGIPLPKSYAGPRYQLPYRYPQKSVPPPSNPPWRKALNGKPIGADNAIAYVNALKNYIAPTIKTLVNDYTKWDPIAAGWYDQPWIASANPDTKWPGREAIQGSYPGPGFGTQYYGVAIQDYVMVYYNPTAAFTLYKVWQHNTNPYKPNLSEAQFEEGSIIVKLATTSAQGENPRGPNYWPVLKGTARSKVFQPPFNAPKGSHPPPVVTDVSALQFDLIVKDTRTTTEAGSASGWVFATLVYDKDAPGATPWDRMVPLGAMWGNDPEVAAVEPIVNVGKAPNQRLNQTVVNPAAPAYAKITLGYGGRLSGPNDAAVNIQPPASTNVSGQSFGFFRMSSCMSCHGVAAAPPSATLVPINDQHLWLDPGSPAWLAYFQSRPGTVAQPPGTAALDYDMVMTQALSNLQAASKKPADVDMAKARVRALRLRGGASYRQSED